MDLHRTIEKTEKFQENLFALLHLIILMAFPELDNE